MVELISCLPASGWRGDEEKQAALARVRARCLKKEKRENDPKGDNTGGPEIAPPYPNVSSNVAGLNRFKRIFSMNHVVGLFS